MTSLGQPKDYKVTLADVFNRNSSTYDQTGVFFFTPVGEKLARLASVKPGDSVLDVGCGRGACVFPVAEAVGPSGHVSAIDISTEMIDHLHVEARQRKLGNVEAQVMDADHPDFATASFDVVLGSFSFVLLSNPLEALARYLPLLRGERKLAMTAPVFTTGMATWPYGSESMVEVLKQITANTPDPEATGTETFADTASLFSEHENIVAGLDRAGYYDVEIVDDDYELTMDTPQQLVDWTYTQGTRLFWESHPTERRLELEEALKGEAEALRDVDGYIKVRAPIRYITATGKPVSRDFY